MSSIKNFRDLSDRQQNILKFIDKYKTENGLSPSIREICDDTSTSSTFVVSYNLDKLENSGWIKRTRGVSRGIHLIRPIPKAYEVPFVSKIVAGQPIQIDIEDSHGKLIEVPPSLRNGRDLNGVYAFEVEGDSMIEANINEGDIVFMSQQNTARNGDIVAAWLQNKGEITLKYYYKEGNKIRLQPAHPDMQPIYVDAQNCQIQGVYIDVKHQYKVFVSYSGVNKESANNLVKQLKEMGHTVWIDDHLLGGQQWWDEITRKVRECQVFVAGYSPTFFASVFCEAEWSYALQLNRHILPVVLNSIKDSDIPLNLGGIHYALFNDENPQKLELALQSLSQIPPLPEPMPPPPPRPIPPINKFSEMLRRSELSYKDQNEIVSGLEELISRNHSNKDAKRLLDTLLNRFDVSKRIADKIDEILSSE
jgi:repressor LexA